MLAARLVANKIKQTDIELLITQANDICTSYNAIHLMFYVVLSMRVND